VLLALGRLHVNKGFDVLMAALPALPRAVLWLGGIGPEETALRRLAEQLGIAGRVRFLGWRQDVPALMAAADVFVCSSRHEPLGNVVLEAWAQRIPVVATIAAGPAALVDDRESGLLVPIDDADALAAAIKSVLDDKPLMSALVEAGFAAYSTGYTEQSVVAKYCNFFEQVTR
jgi:glycosyltransferase involved in cell wall biosynthesis